jgi:hypothetical protein
VIKDVLETNYSYFDNAMKRKGKNPEEELQRLGHIGTICHYRVLNKISSVPLPMPVIPRKENPKDARKYADLFQMMWDQLGLKVSRARCEQFGHSDKYRYCGTYDIHGNMTGTVKDKRKEGNNRVITLNGESVLLDLKTSVQPRDDAYYYQLGGYAELIDAEIDYGIIACLCPYIERNKMLLPKLYILDHNELQHYRQEFIKMTDLWWNLYGNKR